MKRPSISLNGPAIADFLLRHVEKFVVTAAGLAAAWIAWQGVQAVRFQSVRADQTPAALRTGADAAKKHIAALDTTPDGLLPPHESLATQVAGWRAAQAENRGDLPLLDKPLFEDLARRTQPVALPMEDLRAVAGLAVLPAAQPPAAREPEAQRPSRGRGRGPVEQAAPEPVGPTARIVPYVLVTGLIPAAKQLGEYGRAFAAAGYRDARRDAPLWSDFEIDRGSVGPDGKETWQRIDLAATAMQMARWSSTAAELVPPPYLLGAAEDGRNAKTTPLAFCGPLPERIDEQWGPEQVHPWVLEQVRVAARQVPARPAPQAVPPAAYAGAPSPFGEFQPANPPVPERVAETPRPAAAAEEPAVPALRMFRFLDTAVEPGRVYRYRARLKVWNPNWRLEPQWLADPALAGPQVLASADSGPSPAVRIPAKLSMLVEPLAADDVKRLKLRPGLFEVLVLDESRATGSYSLRSVLTEMGGFANVEDLAAKAGDRGGEQRGRGEPVATGRVLIDVFGAQIDPADMPSQRGTKPGATARGGLTEPLEMMFLRPDGGVELASAAEAQPLVRRYRETLLPAVKDQPAAGPEAAPLDGQFNPFPQLPR